MKCPMHRNTCESLASELKKVAWLGGGAFGVLGVGVARHPGEFVLVTAAWWVLFQFAAHFLLDCEEA